MKKIILILGLLLLGCSGDDVVMATSQPDSGIADARLSDATFYKDVIVTPIQDAAIDAHDWDSGFEAGSFDIQSNDNSPIFYYGGPVMTHPINVYLIWYGNWGPYSKSVSILEDMISNVGGSSWFQINGTYFQQKGDLDAGDASIVTTDVNTNVTLAKSIYIGYSNGHHIYDVASVVSDVLTSNQLPLDSDGIYFLLTSADVQETSLFQGFCITYCGWHNNMDVAGIDIKYSFVGNPEACPDACSLHPNYDQAGIFQSPNNDWSADGMASIMLHELAESVTDPNPLSLHSFAWQTSNGAENADKCAWSFGSVFESKNGSVANVTIGNRDYMIQQNWVLDPDAGVDAVGGGMTNGHCGLHL